MRYVVGYVDPKSGKTQFRAYDYQNDASEFVDLHKKRGYWAQLYVAKDEPQKRKVEAPIVQMERCPVCLKDVKILTEAGWCKKCQETME